MGQKLSNVRIISGSLRSRKITFLAEGGVRPTQDQVRETLFSWLNPYIQGAICLDAFAGTGACSFEAISRGASQVICYEYETNSAAMIEKNKDHLVINNLFVRTENIMNQWTTLKERFDIIFLDPPFDKDYLNTCLNEIVHHELLKQDGVIYFECANKYPLELPPGLSLYKHKKKKNVQYGLLMGFHN